MVSSNSDANGSLFVVQTITVNWNSEPPTLMVHTDRKAVGETKATVLSHASDQSQTISIREEV